MLLRKFSQTFKVVMALMLSVLSSGLLQSAPVYASDHQVEICHATSSESNPYIMNSPAKSGNLEGHDGHHGDSEDDVVWYPGAKAAGVDWDDIIPTFTYEEGGETKTYPGKNWTAEGMAIYNNGCQTLTTSLNITPSTCVDQEVDDGTLSITISGSFDNGSKIVLKQGASQVDISGPINDDADLPVLFSNLAAGTYTVSLEKGNDVYATEVVTLTECGDNPDNPTVTATAQPCVQGDVTQDVIVNVTNTDDATDEEVEYTVTVGDESEEITLADGANGNLTFTELPAGDYTVNVAGDDGTSTSTTVTVGECGGRGAGPCVVSNNTYYAPWTGGPVAGASPSTATPGSFEFKSDGLYISTPNIESYVYGEINAGNTPLVDVDEMSYKTLRLLTSTGNNQVVTAYILQVDLDGDIETVDDVTYLFYEPLYNGTVLTGTWQTWDLINDGKSVWWSFDLTGGNPTLTWSEILEEYPAAVVITYGFNQGTSNQGTHAVIQDLEFDCATTTFSKRSTQPETPVTPTTPTNPGQVLGTTTGGQVLGTSTELPETLPATGGEANPFLIIIASLIAYGAAYFLQGRRLIGRSNAFSA